MEAVNAVGNKRILDDDKNLRKSRWYFDMEEEDDDSDEEEKGSSDDEAGEQVNPAPNQLWSSLNMTTEQVECLKAINS